MFKNSKPINIKTLRQPFRALMLLKNILAFSKFPTVAQPVYQMMA